MPTVMKTDWSFDAIGTPWQITIRQACTAEQFLIIKSMIAARIESFDATYSRFRADSLVSSIAKSAGSFRFPTDSNKLFTLYRQLYAMSGGQLTPLIGQTMSDAGYDAEYSLRPKRVSSPPVWPDVMQFRDTVLTTSQPVLLDFGAAGKGYLVDIIAELLLENDVQQFYINAGGDIRCHGLDEPLRVGLEHPNDPEQIIGVMELQNGALCGSAGNRRAWAHYTHIINPITVSSETKIAATWCVADNALTADGLATALYFVEPAQLTQVFDFDYGIAFADGSIHYSQGFKTAIFQPEEALTI